MKRLLVVDDDPAILDTLVDLLSETYEVEGSLDGAIALQRLGAATFDLVVLDLMMPVLDGASLKREMDARGIRTPVIVISATRDLAECARDLGAADFIAKPFDFAALEKKIETLLEPDAAR